MTTNFVSRYWTGDPTALHRSERQSGTIECFVPPLLAAQKIPMSSDIHRAEEDAVISLTEAGRSLGVTSRTEMVGLALMRSEALASSFIEGINVSPTALLRTELQREMTPETDLRRKPGVEVLNNVDALLSVTHALEVGEPITLSMLLDAHQTLMRHTPFSTTAGSLRVGQSWIGGHSPLTAKYVGPPAEDVPALIDDLLGFVNERSLPAMTTAAIAHAQFESIHPFGDGNGRTGRALVHLILRQRGLGGGLLIPISQVIRSDSDAYVRALETTRPPQGAPDWRAWRTYFASTVEEAANRTIHCDISLQLLADDWARELKNVRRDSLVWKVLTELLGHPTVNSQWIQRAHGCTAATADNCLRSLVAAGIVRQVSIGNRNKIFEATSVLEVLERF